MKKVLVIIFSMILLLSFASADQRVVDDFEDGNIDGWFGDTSGFTATSNALNGSFSIKDTSDGVAIKKNLSTTGKYDGFQFLVNYSGGNGPQLVSLIDTSSTRIIRVQNGAPSGSGKVFVRNDGTDIVSTGNFEADKVYRIKLENISYSQETFDFEAYNYSSGSQINSGSAGFSNSGDGSGLEQVRLGAFPSGISYTVDDLTLTNETLGVSYTPSLSNPSPSDGATEVSTTTDLSVDYSDPQGDTGNVSFYWQNGTLIEKVENIASGDTASTSNLDLSEGTNYEWYAEATDGENTTSAGNYSFTTSSSTSTLFDGFEDGDYTSSPTWNVVEDTIGGEKNVTNSEAYNGSYSLKLTSPGDQDNDRTTFQNGDLDSSNIDSGTELGFAFKVTDATSSYSRYHLSSESTEQTGDYIEVLIGGNNNQSVILQSDDGNSVSVGSLTADTWYEVDIEFIDSNSIDVRLYNSSGLVGEITNYQTDNAMTMDYTYFWIQDGTNANALTLYYDQVGYKIEKSYNPSLSNPSPSDGATEVSTTTDLSVDYSDPQGDTGNVSFYWQNGTLIEKVENIASGDTASTSNLDLSIDTTYNWYVEATDGENTTSAGNYSFTTTDPFKDWFYNMSQVTATYGITTPNAKYVSEVNSTFVVIQGKDLDPYAFRYDHGSKTWSEAVEVGDNPLTSDTHGSPSLTVDEQGYIHVFFGSHNQERVQYRRSTDTYNISQWEEPSTNVGDSHTYPQPIVVNDTIYHFYRENDETSPEYQYRLSLKKSTDNGDNWTSVRPLVDLTDQDSSGYRIYASGPKYDSTRDVIQFAWMRTTDSSGTTRVNLYHAYLNLTDNELYSLDGTNYGNTISSSSSAKVYDSGSLRTNDVRLQIDSNGDPHLGFLRELSTGEFMHSYIEYGSGSWEGVENITETDGYFNGSALYLESDNDLEAYLSVSPVNSGGNAMEEWHYNGSDWTLNQTLIDESAYSDGFHYDNPTIVKNSDSYFKTVFTQQDPSGSDYSSNNIKAFGWGDEGFVTNNLSATASPGTSVQDTTPPTSSDNWSASGFVDKSSVDVELTASDNSGGSGVSNISWRVNGGAYTTVSGSSTVVTISSQGNNSLEYYATDVAGNVESVNTEYVALDDTPPTINYNPSTTEAGIKTGQDWIYINVTATDNQDLVSVTQEFNGVNSSFANQNGDYYWENHTNLQNGNYTINAFAEDSTGSVSSTGERSIEIDTPTQEFNEFNIDTESEWNQGTSTNISTSQNSGFLQLEYGLGNSNSNATIINRNNNALIGFDHGNQKTHTLDSDVTSQRIGGLADVTGNGVKEISYVDTSNNLKYYNVVTKTVTDTGVNAQDVGAFRDLDSDSDKELLFINNQEISYYDFTDSSITSVASGQNFQHIGYTGDYSSDGDLDVIATGEANSEYTGWVVDIDTGDLEVTDSPLNQNHDSGDIVDYNDDGTVEAIINRGIESYNIITPNDFNSITVNSDSYNPLAPIVDYDSQGSEDILLRNGNSLDLYDLGFSSQSTLYTDSEVSNFNDFGGYDDIGYPSSGNYTSQIINYDKKQEWNNLSVKSLERLNSGEVNITVETSNDGFDTINQSQTIDNSSLIDGTNTYVLDSLTSTTTSARIKIFYSKGSSDTSTIDGLTLNSAVENQPPTIPQQEIKWLNLGSNNQLKEISYVISDPDPNDIRTRNTPPSGTVTEFTNSSLVVQGFNNVFDYHAEVTDTRDQTGSINSNFTLSETTSLYTPTSGFVNNESYQSVSGAIEVDIRGDSSIYQFNASRPSNWLETVTNGDTSTSSSTTGTITSNWQWYVDQITTKRFDTEVDPSRESTPDTQYVIRNKQVTHAGGTSFSQLEIQPIQPEVGTCSNCNARNISINSGQVKNVSFNASGDFLDRQQQFDFKPSTSPVVLGIDYQGTRNYQVRETADFNWSDINITGEVTAPSQCSQFNNTEIDIPAQSFKNYTVGFNCDPGNIGNPSQQVLNISGGERINISSFDMQINTNETSNSDVVIRTEKDQWQSSNAYDGGSLEAKVEGVTSNSSEVNITDTGSFFRIRVGDIQNSSLYTDDSDWSITYTDTDAPDVGGGGGGGIPDSDDQVITFGSTTSEEGIESFNVPFGTTVTRELTIRNSRQDTVTAQIQKGSGSVCEFVSVERSIDSGTFGNSGVYEMPPAELSSLGNVRRSTETVLIQFSLPSESELDSSSNMTCSFTTSSSYGTAENLVVEASQGFNLGFLGGEYCISVPYASLADDGSVNSNPVSVCFVLWQWLLVIASIVGIAVFVYRRTS